MNIKYSSAFYLVICVAAQPLLEAQASDAAVAGIVGAVIGVACAGFGVHAWHTSQYRQEQEAEREHKIIIEAQAVLDNINEHCYSILLEPNVSYNDLASVLSTQLVSLKNQLDRYLQDVEHHRNRLKEVTGKHGDVSKLYYEQAQHLYHKFFMLKEIMTRCNELLDKLAEYRDEPIRFQLNVRPFMDEVKAHMHSLPQLMNWASFRYAKEVTSSQIKGYPLVCAVEDINNCLAKISLYKKKFEMHQALMAGQQKMYSEEAVLSTFNAWCDLLEVVAANIASTEQYLQQVRESQARAIERLNASADFEREKKKRLDGEYALQQALNRSKELEIQNKQATTNLTQSMANLVESHRQDEIQRLEEENKRLKEVNSTLERVISAEHANSDRNEILVVACR